MVPLAHLEKRMQIRQLIIQVAMDRTKKAQATLAGPPRILIACVRCKTRKIRCNGETPQCGNCVTRGAECNYAPARKYRGPGKGKHNSEAVEGVKQLSSSSSQPPDNGNSSSQYEKGKSISPAVSLTNVPKSPTSYYGTIINNPTAQQQDASVGPSPRQVSIQSRLQIFPDFLLPDAFDTHLKSFKGNLGCVNTAQRFAPLMPQHISRRMVQNSFADIMADHQLLDLPNFLVLLDAQYADSSIAPAEDPSRWAFVNAIIALAARFKIAPGSEAELSDIAHGFYQNAVTVIPEVILRDPSLLSVQALLGMAIFARGIPDTRACIMLTANASRQLELFNFGRLTVGCMIGVEEEEQYQQLCRVAYKFHKDTGYIIAPSSNLR
ncbi:hypothetical protein EDB80DRAFT_278757 [Ilyonectria destructans]|nr:hypothetical protein EDB80DRAFT_278757 [Ilyonectria destructans]